MDFTDERTVDQLTNAFKYFNKFMVMIFRLGLDKFGNGTKWGGWLMVINHKGRKTGLNHRTPVNYYQEGDKVYCLASTGMKSDWYLNMMAEPNVELWMKDGWWKGYAEDVTNTENRVELLYNVLVASGFAAYAFGMAPNKLTTADLEAMLDQYNLVQITKGHPKTGEGGPGDLNWVWPVAAIILLIKLCCKRNSYK